MVQQILSILKQTSGISRAELTSRITKNWAFKNLTQHEIEQVIDYLVKIELIEDLHRELILGIRSQYLVTGKDFYAVFEAKRGFQVIYKDKTIGEIDPPTFGKSAYYINENIFLAAQIWKIVDVDDKKGKYFVERSKDGKPPLFLDNGGREIHPRIREKMLEILLSSQSFAYLDEKSQVELQDLKNRFKQFQNIDIVTERPIIEQHGKTDLYLFTGSKTQYTVHKLIDYMNQGLLESPNKDEVSLRLKLNKQEALKFWQKLAQNEIDFYKVAEETLDQDPSQNTLTKYFKFLPLNLQIQLYQEFIFDLDNYKDLSSKIRLVV